MKLVHSAIIVCFILFAALSCNNSPSEAEIEQAAKAKEATLINQPDPYQERLSKVAQQYDKYIQQKMQEYQLPGLAYALVKDGEVLSMRSYGYRKVGTKDSIDEHTSFRLASVSKGFAAVLAGLLVDKGLVKWDDKIIDHLPSFRLSTSDNTQNISLRHTLSQTSGLRKYAGGSYIYQGLSYPSILKKMRYAKVDEAPGEVFAYQNAIFSVIHQLAKKVTSQSYESLMDTLLFAPLQMQDASLGYKKMIRRENKGLPHIRSKKRWKASNIRKSWYNVPPAAGVNASVNDMAIWLNAMLGHYPEIVPSSVLKEIFRPHIPINEDSDYYQTWFPGLNQASYGMGWRIFDYNKHQIIYHGGFVRGYRPEIGLCPKEDVGVVFLTNASKNDLSSACIKAFFDIYFAPELPS